MIGEPFGQLDASSEKKTTHLPQNTYLNLIQPPQNQDILTFPSFPKAMLLVIQLIPATFGDEAELRARELQAWSCQWEDQDVFSNKKVLCGGKFLFCFFLGLRLVNWH